MAAPFALVGRSLETVLTVHVVLRMFFLLPLCPFCAFFCAQSGLICKYLLIVSVVEDLNLGIVMGGIPARFIICRPVVRYTLDIKHKVTFQ